MKGQKVSKSKLIEIGKIMLGVLKKCGFHRFALEILENDLFLLAQTWSYHNKFRKGAGLICPVITPVYSSLPDSMDRVSFRARGYAMGSLVQFNSKPETSTSLAQSASKLPHWLINLPNPNYTLGMHPENAGREISGREAPNRKVSLDLDKSELGDMVRKLTAKATINDYGFLNTEELIFYTAFYGILGKYSYCANLGRLSGTFESRPVILLNAAGQVELTNENPTEVKNIVYPFCFSRSLGMNS